jgi:small multidrug resistance family-3 protein
MGAWFLARIGVINWMEAARIGLLFLITAVCEIGGCYLAYLYMRKGATPRLLLPAFAALAVFAWLLTLHPVASGRVYAAYGGIYIAVALLWLRWVDGVRLMASDWIGAVICLLGALVIISGWSGAR